MQPNEMVMLSLVLLSMAALPSMSTLLITTNTLVYGVRSGLFSAMGVVLGDVIWLLLALSGLAAVYPLMTSHWSVVKTITAFFLIFLGVKLVWVKQNTVNQTDGMSNTNRWPGFVAGLMLTLADYKAILFYLAVLPALVVPGTLSLSNMFAVLLITILSVGTAKLAYVAVILKLDRRQPDISVTGLRYVAALLLFIMAASLLVPHGIF